METKHVPEQYDVLAPDGSEIRLLQAVKGGSFVHCTLPAKAVTKPVSHRTVEEIWYFLEGNGQVWRKLGDDEAVTDVYEGVSLTIPLGAHFQFRNTSDEPLKFVIVTMPPWSGDDEAVHLDKGYWDY